MADITTALIAWMAANAADGDVTTRMRDTLGAAESYGAGVDLTTLMTQFDFNSADEGGTLREMPAFLRQRVGPVVLPPVVVERRIYVVTPRKRRPKRMTVAPPEPVQAVHVEDEPIEAEPIAVVAPMPVVARMWAAPDDGLLRPDSRYTLEDVGLLPMCEPEPTPNPAPIVAPQPIHAPAVPPTGLARLVHPWWLLIEWATGRAA